MKSIYFKNFAATAVMVMFSFLILGTAFVFLGRSYVISEYRDNMVSNAEEVSHAAQALVRDGELSNWDLRMVISTLAQSTGNHIFITDTDGTIVSCSCRNIACEHLGRTVGAASLVQLRSDGKLNLITNLGGFYSSAHYVVAQPITIGTAARVVGYVFVATNSATIIDGWRTFVWVFLAASAAVMMIALLLSLVTSKRMAQPLDEMAVAAKKFAHGDFSARVTDDGRTDEVGALISAFNTMADSLETSEQRRNAFIANVSHELKTPMTTIAGFADGILDGTIPKDQEDKYLATIADETRRLSRLVRSMLDMSRLESTGEDLTRRREFDISEKIVSTMLSFEARANDKQLDVDLQLPEDSMQVLADPDAITRVLYNLMDNAVKFAAPGSTLCVSLWKSEGKAIYGLSVSRTMRSRGPARRPAVHLRPLPQVRPQPQPRPRRRGSRIVPGQEHPRRARRGHRRHEPRRGDGVRVHAHARKARAQAHCQAGKHRPTGRAQEFMICSRNS